VSRSSGTCSGGGGGGVAAMVSPAPAVGAAGTAGALSRRMTIVTLFAA